MPSYYKQSCLHHFEQPKLREGSDRNLYHGMSSLGTLCLNCELHMLCHKFWNVQLVVKTNCIGNLVLSNQYEGEDAHKLTYGDDFT